jgi:Putative peptidoglycan binding domain
MIIMKKLSSLLIGCSLALAGAAWAQQPAEQQSPSKGKRAPEKTHAAEAQPGGQQKAHAPQPQGGPNAAKPQERPGRQTGALKERGAPNERAATGQPGGEKGKKTGRESANPAETNVSGQPAGGTTNEPGAEKGRKAAEKTSANPAAGMPTQVGKEQQVKEQGGKHPLTEASAAPPASGGVQQNAQAKAGVKAKKPEPQQVQQVKSEHANFHAQPKPQQVQPVTFNQNHHIEGSEHWQGHQYEVFRSYHSEWHDEGWYHSHYPNVVLIAGGYYFFNNGYWFPAWGYSPSAQYYAYDGPIYAGHHAEPPDKVIADTQALLQQMGYYKGEVDGLLGPLTREALTAYQTDNGLTVTAVIDEPTLDSLGLS